MVRTTISNVALSHQGADAAAQTLQNEAALTPAATPHTTRWPPKLFLLFSHTLTAEQAADARAALGVTDIVALPPALQARWSDVPPALDCVAEHLQPVFDWLAQAARPGDYVLAQGDFGAVDLAVTWACDHALRPVYATTARRAVETPRPDGTVQVQRIFQHVRFRRYVRPVR